MVGMEPEGVERRLAAILSADVVAYSRLMAEDEEATVRRLGVYREQIGALIGEHRGRLADFSGDNFLAEFPTALGAVGCAIEIQRVLRARNAGLPVERKMEFRIGAHLGDVRVEDGRIFGDGVNIAARLEGLAEPGGICISATVHEQVRNRLEVGYVDRGDQTVKNIPEQVHVFEVRLEPGSTASARPTAARRPWRVAALIATAVVAVCALGIWTTWPRVLGLGAEVLGVIPSNQPALPDKPSIVVLPFANMSGDAEQEYFADGMTEGPDDGPLKEPRSLRDLAELGLQLQRRVSESGGRTPRARGALRARGKRPPSSRSRPHHRPADRCDDGLPCVE